MRTREEKGVGTIIDTFVVSSCNTGLICTPETCQVRCKSCPPTASCAHTLVCSCSTFNSKYACDHLHFVLHHQCSEPNDKASKDPDDSKVASNVDNSSSKPFIKDLNINRHSYYPDIGRFKEHLLQNQHDYQLRSDKEEDSEFNEDTESFVDVTDEIDKYDLSGTDQSEVVSFFISFIAPDN